MKILFVNKFLYSRGGAETYFLKLGKILKECGHQVEYFGMEDEKNIVGNREHLYTKNMDFHGRGIDKLTYPFKIIYSLEAKKKISKVIRSFQPDIIHFNNINFQLTPSVIEAGAKLGIPMVQTVHDLQMLCPNHMMLDIQKKVPCECCIEGKKWSCISKKCIHNSRIKSIIGLMENMIYSRKKTYDLIDTYICPSHFIEEKLLHEQRFQGKTIVIHNFLSENYMDIQKEKKNYVLYFGRISQEKGIDRLLEACALTPEISYVIAGSGPEEHLCVNSKLPNVSYVGFQSGKALLELIQGALFTVHLSIWYENCPLAVLESQSLGTPVLCNKIGGMPELVEEKETGILNEVFTPEAYAEKIRYLYNEKELLKEMAKKCLEKQETMITLEKYKDALLDIYNETIQKKKKEKDSEKGNVFNL